MHDAIESIHISVSFDLQAVNPCLRRGQRKGRREHPAPMMIVLGQNSRWNFAVMAEITGPMKKHTTTVTTPTVPPIR